MVDSTRPDFSSIALITIDTQRDVLDGQPFEIPGTSQILPKIKSLVDTFRASGRPIIHMVRLYKADGKDVDLCRRDLVREGAEIFRPGTPGCELVIELLEKPEIRLDTERLLAGKTQILGPNEVIMYKPRWGAFFRTALMEHLHKIGSASLAFTGCNYPNCPRASIYEASERDFRIVLLEDAVSGLYERGKEEMHRIGVWLMNVKELEESIISRLKQI